MNDLIIKKFKNKNFYSFIWKDKPCWIGNDIADIFVYTQNRKAISNCINRENFELGIEYDVLEGEKLKFFKEVFSEQLGDTKYAPKIIIFYEEGLYGFLSYTEMPLGVEFRNWIRREVMPTIREKGYYVYDKEDMTLMELKNERYNEVIEGSFEIRVQEHNKIENIKVAYESASMFKELLDKITMDSTYKFLLIKPIYIDAGINLPKYIEEERF